MTTPAFFVTTLANFMTRVTIFAGVLPSYFVDIPYGFIDIQYDFIDIPYGFIEGVRRFHTVYAHRNTQTVSFYRRNHTVDTVTLQLICRFNATYRNTIFPAGFLRWVIQYLSQIRPKFCKSSTLNLENFRKF